MNFNDLTIEEKKDLQVQLMECVNIAGGVNPFLTILEEIRTTKPKPLLNKTAIFHSTKVKFMWGKTIYKDSLDLVHKAMINEEKNNNIFANLNPSDYKKTMNTIRMIKPITVTMVSKESEDSFSFPILDTTIEKNTKFTLLFKVFFFYSIDFAKEILNFKEVQS